MVNSAHAIIVHNKKVLLLLRDNKPGLKNANKWSLIGGGVDEGESSQEALIREINEELCIEIEQFDFLGEARTEDGRKGIFYIRLNNKQAKSIKLGNEGQKIGFFSIDEVGELELTKKLNSFFKRHRDHIENLVNDAEMPDPHKLGLK